VLWAAAVILTAAAACLRPEALPPAARATLGPFATLAAIIAGSVLADRLGVFRMLAGLLIRDRAPARWPPPRSWRSPPWSAGWPISTSPSWWPCR
jgi:hypothetical protein